MPEGRDICADASDLDVKWLEMLNGGVGWNVLLSFRK
jgi:hypothetical protein